MKSAVAVALGGAILALAACGDGVEGTEVLTYAPWQPNGELNEDVELAAEVTGSCFGPSSIVQRSDAYRCALDSPAPDGSTLLDPCFTGTSGAVACVNEPGGEAVVVRLTEASPEAGHLEAGSREAPPWAMTLESGEKCVFTGGATAAVGSERLNYFCADGLMVYGEPDRADPVWTVRVGTEGSSTLSRSGVAAAWF